MKIEDEVREALRSQADRVTASQDEAWDRVTAPRPAPTTSRRIAAASVAVAVFAAAGVLLVRTLQPSTTQVQQSPATYASVADLAAALNTASLGCDQVDSFQGIMQPGVDVGSCQVNGADAVIWVYQTPKAVREFEDQSSIDTNPKVFNVRGQNWLVATTSLPVAHAIQAVIGGTLEGAPAPTETANTGAVSITKGTTLDVSGGQGLAAAAQEAFGSLWVVVQTDADLALNRVDPTSGTQEASFPLSGWSNGEWGGEGIVIGDGHVWTSETVHGSGTLLKIDPATNKVEMLPLDADVISYLSWGSDGMLWANISTAGNSAIAQIDPATGTIVQRWPFTAEWSKEVCESSGAAWVHEMAVSNSGVHGGWLSQVVPGSGLQVTTGGTFAGPVCSQDAVWTAAYGDSTSVNLANGIAKIDPTTGLIVGSWKTPAVGYDIALDDQGGVWFLTAATGEIERLDTVSRKVENAGAVTGTPIFIAPAGDHVWVGTYEGHLVRFDFSHD